MRAYFFGNMYLSSIQQGIQAQHCTAELFVKYQAGHPEKLHDTLYQWARLHKTSILLNGGGSVELQNLVDILNTNMNPYPWATFRESSEALNSVRTCVGIILPERVYAAAEAKRRALRRDSIFVSDLTTWEHELVDVLNGCGLAR